MKICSGCKTEKPLDDFSKSKAGAMGRQSYCKSCANKKRTEYYKNNSDKEKLAAKRWYRENRDRSLILSKKYNYENRDKIRSCSREYKRKRREDPRYRVERRVRHRVWKAIKRFGKNKSSKTFDLVGCDQEYLLKHIESQFREDMSWENYGQWHIDHIIPLASAKTEEKLIALFHYTNLQPLWAEENIRKGARVDYCNYKAAS